MRLVDERFEDLSGRGGCASAALVKGNMEAAMDLMRRMPPSLSQQALDSLLALLPAHSSELLSRSDQPLQVPLSLFYPQSLFFFF